MVAPTTLRDEEVRRVLARMLESQTFSGARGSCAFLKFIVEETLAGRAASLKEFTIGARVFDRGSYDPRTDPIVRVQARRLRQHIDRYHRMESWGDEVLIDLPKGRYIPHFQARCDEAGRRCLADNECLVYLSIDGLYRNPTIADLCQGFKHDLIHALTSIPELRVLNDSHPSRVCTGNVKYAFTIVGHVRKSANKIRIIVQVTDAVENCYVVSRSADWDADHITLADLDVLTQDLSESIRTAVSLRLRPPCCSVESHPISQSIHRSCEHG